MKGRKLEARENRLNGVKARVEARMKVLKERGLEEKLIKKDSMMRSLLAEVRKVQRSIESLQWEPPPKVEQAEKPAKEAAKPKAPKPPKEKKPKKEENAPPG